MRYNLTIATVLVIGISIHIGAIEISMPGRGDAAGTEKTTSSLSGQVVDSITGLGIAGIDVTIFDEDGNPTADETTDASGNYVVASLAAGTYYAGVVSGEAYEKQLYDGESCAYCSPTSGTPILLGEGQNQNAINFSLDPLAFISGQITAADTGLPLPGVDVVVTSPYSGVAGAVGWGTTDELGHYTTTGFPTGTVFVETDNDLGYADERYDDYPCSNGGCDFVSGTAIVLTPGESAASINFELVPGGAISGTVTDVATGLPLSGVYVQFRATTGHSGGFAQTDSTGSFWAHSLRPGDYRVYTSNTIGYLNQSYPGIECAESCTLTFSTPVSVAAGMVTTDVDFALVKGGSISGTVRDATTSEGVVGVYLRIYDEFQTNWQYLSVDGGGDGTYRTTVGLPDGRYYVEADPFSTSDYLGEVYSGQQCPPDCSVLAGTPVDVEIGCETSGVDFALTKGGRVSGTVVAADTGGDIDWTMQFFETSGDFGQIAWSWGSGSYTSRVLPSGSVFARVSGGSGYLPELYDNIVCPAATCDVSTGDAIPVSSGSTTAGINFTLQKGATIQGTVADASSGDAIEGMTVEIIAADGTTVSVAWTDPDGHYLTIGLVPGTYFAEAGWNSFSYPRQIYSGVPCHTLDCDPTTGTPIVISDVRESVTADFALVQGGNIMGTITDAVTNSPLEGTVEFFNSAGEQVAWGAWEGGNNHLGIYTSQALPAGQYYVRAWFDEHVDEVYNDQPCCGCDPTTGGAVTVVQGATATAVDFALSPYGGWISGNAIDTLSLTPAADVVVKIYNAAGQLATTAGIQDNGLYRTAIHLLPGDYYAVATSPDGRFASQLYDGITCADSCDPLQGVPIVIVDNQETPNIDFSMLPPGCIFADGFEHGDTQAWGP